MALGAKAIKKKAKIFFVLSGVFAVMAPFGLIPSETPAEGDMARGIVGCVLFGSVALFFLFFTIKETKKLRNPFIVRRYGEEIAAKAALFMPDFAVTNEFMVRVNAKSNGKVWLNKDTGQIQFLLPKDGDKSSATSSKKVPLQKSKAIELSKMRDITLRHSAKRITHIGGYGINPMSQSTFVAAGGTKTESIKVFYEVDFVFDDVDLPFVGVYFGRDEVGAKRLYHCVLLLSKRSSK